MWNRRLLALGRNGEAKERASEFLGVDTVFDSPINDVAFDILDVAPFVIFFQHPVPEGHVQLFKQSHCLKGVVGAGKQFVIGGPSDGYRNDLYVIARLGQLLSQTLDVRSKGLTVGAGVGKEIVNQNRTRRQGDCRTNDNEVFTFFW